MTPPPGLTRWRPVGAGVRMDPVPAVGEHTERILAFLGRSAEQIAALRDAGVI
ncbi:hypothetical protein ACQEVZ_47700 [Dactylosporangium sp. CA-152071]|uniref:hypothetical protein n=1 Tax=Dactylosporangium sp. CA-152071 TaxID=3239933 RepID=UPI003D903726